MKIRELLASVISKVNPNAIIKIIRKPANASLTDKFIYYEKYLSWRSLKSLLREDVLEKQCTPENLAPFFKFLAHRWERIHHIYQLSYNYTYKEELTSACYELATKLATTLGGQVHPLKILMPTLETYNENLMMDLVEIDSLATKEERTQLHHFIMDHWGHVINIADCLNYASYSISETILYHTSAQLRVEVDEKPDNPNLPQVRALDRQDKTRVMYHSKEAFAVINAINQLVKEMSILYNAADAVATLADYLHKGGIRGGYDGNEAASGNYSYIGVRKFYDFTKKLSPDDFSSLMAASAIYNSYTYSFKHIWMHLLASSIGHPESDFSETEIADILNFIAPYFTANLTTAQRTREILCADQYSIKLLEIKNLTPYLRNLRIDKNKADNKDLLVALDNAYLQALTKFENGILTKKLTHFSHKEIENFPIEVRKALTDEIEMTDFCKRLANTNNDFVQFLLLLPQDLHDTYIQNLGLPFLRNIIASASQLVEVLQAVDHLPVNQKKTIQTFILESLTKEYLQEIIITKKTRSTLAKYLTTDLFVDFMPQNLPPPQRYNLSFLDKWPRKAEKKSDKVQRLDIYPITYRRLK